MHTSVTRPDFFSIGNHIVGRYYFISFMPVLAMFMGAFHFCSSGNSYLLVSDMVAVVRCSQQASEI
jgi:hypothetical protein